MKGKRRFRLEDRKKTEPRPVRTIITPAPVSATLETTTDDGKVYDQMFVSNGMISDLKVYIKSIIGEGDVKLAVMRNDAEIIIYGKVTTGVNEIPGIIPIVSGDIVSLNLVGTKPLPILQGIYVAFNWKIDK